jgi:hypothetical protein
VCVSVLIGLMATRRYEGLEGRCGHGDMKTRKSGDLKGRYQSLLVAGRDTNAKVPRAVRSGSKWYVWSGGGSKVWWQRQLFVVLVV